MKKESMKNAEKQSGGGGLSVEDNQSLFLYILPGALAYGQGNGLDGYYHMGIDINYGEKSPVYPLKGGAVCDIIDIVLTLQLVFSPHSIFLKQIPFKSMLFGICIWRLIKTSRRKILLLLTLTWNHQQ